jgi:hypothetical protein
MKSLFGYSSAQVGRKDNFRPRIWNEISHDVSNNNGARVINYSTRKKQTFKSVITFSLRNNHNFIMAFPDGNTIKLVTFG